MSIEQDLHNRHLIENDTSTNYFVEAGAGSGKTTELVARMLSMVENGVNGQDIDISQICAITFTKAAANEFYDRFQKALIDSGTPKAKEALKNIDLCFMGTIDSFTNMIISEHPSSADVPADSVVADEDQLQQIWKSYLKEIADGKFGEELQKKYNLFIKFCKDSEDYFVSGLKFLMNTKNVKFIFEKPQNENFSLLFKNEINDIMQALEFLVGDNVRVQNKTKSDNKAVYFAKLLLKLCENFEDNINLILGCINKICGKQGLRFDKSTNLETYPDIPDYVKNLFTQTFTDKGSPSYWIINPVSDVDNPFHKWEFDNYIYSITADFFYDCREVISKELKAQGILSYSDYLYYLKETLKKDVKSGGKLIDYIYKRHKYYLIDEFQDTDPIQAEVFFYLTASNLSLAKSWKECIPYPGSLFIVGDPKQSIYRFRNADVSSYLSVKNLFNNPDVGKVLELKQNFRSYRPVCEWFNNSFIDILKDNQGIQSAYEPIPLENKNEYNGSLGGAYLHEYKGSKIKTSPATENLCTIIDQLVDNEKYTVEDPPRKISYQDIMVITYSKRHLKYYMDAFRENNIPYWVEGNVLFEDCPALKCLSAYINLINNPHDKKAIQASRIHTKCNFELEDVIKYKKDACTMPPSAFVSMLIDEERIIAQFGTKNIEYLYYALELIRSMEVSCEISSIADVAKFLSLLLSGENKLERCLQFAKNANCVHIANLHKVKGLQAPVVIMTEAKMNNRAPDIHVNYLQNNPFCVMFKIAGSGFGSGISNWCYPQYKQLESDILNAEKDRLLYVAATRAKSVFIATNFKKNSGDGICSNNQAVNLIDHISRAVPIGDNILDDGTIIVENKRNNSAKKIIKNAEEANDLYEQAYDTNVLNNKKILNSYKIVKPSDIDDNDQNLRSGASVDMQDNNFNNENLNPALRGTIVHRLMELIVNARDFDGSHNKWTEAVVAEFDLKDNTIRNLLNNACNYAKPLFDKLKCASEIYCELPFCYFQENKIINGFIDLIYKIDNEWHIVDYKTNYNDKDLDQKYESQLSLYKSAFKEIMNQNATTEILHFDL